MTRWRRSPLPPDWDTIIRPAILERDRHRCRIRGPRCEIVATEVDHIHGHDDHRPDNLQAACGTCHRTKTGREAARIRWVERQRHPDRWKRERPTRKHPGLT